VKEGKAGADCEAEAERQLAYGTGINTCGTYSLFRRQLHDFERVLRDANIQERWDRDYVPADGQKPPQESDPQAGYSDICDATQSDFACHSACKADFALPSDPPDYRCSQCYECRCEQCQILFAQAADAAAIQSLAAGECKDLEEGCGCPLPGQKTSACET
jgi:hypothetical protein